MTFWRMYPDEVGNGRANVGLELEIVHMYADLGEHMLASYFEMAYKCWHDI